MAAVDPELQASPAKRRPRGATGAGKSTAIALLHRAFDPQSGVIEIDGIDIRKFRLSATAAEHWRGVSRAPAVQPLHRRHLAWECQMPQRKRCGTARRAQALDFIERKFRGI